MPNPEQRCKALRDGVQRIPITVPPPRSGRAGTTRWVAASPALDAAGRLTSGSVRRSRGADWIAMIRVPPAGPHVSLIKIRMQTVQLKPRSIGPALEPGATFRPRLGSVSTRIAHRIGSGVPGSLVGVRSCRPRGTRWSRPPYRRCSSSGSWSEVSRITLFRRETAGAALLLAATVVAAWEGRYPWRLLTLLAAGLLGR
jgi:hypothetical protein